MTKASNIGSQVAQTLARYDTTQAPQDFSSLAFPSQQGRHPSYISDKLENYLLKRENEQLKSTLGQMKDMISNLYSQLMNSMQGLFDRLMGESQINEQSSGVNLLDMVANYKNRIRTFLQNYN